MAGGCGGCCGWHHLNTLLCPAAPVQKHPGANGDLQPRSPPPQSDRKNSSSRSLLRVVVEVAVVVVAPAGCGGAGDGHLYVDVVLDVIVKFFLVRIWSHVKGC